MQQPTKTLPSDPSSAPARHIAIVGATSAMAEHCARLWLGQGPARLTLLGRDAARLERVAQDLRVRSPQSRIDTMTADFLRPEDIARAVDEICAGGAPDIALIAHGTLPEQRQCEADLDVCAEAMAVNGISPALFAERFATHLQRAGRGRIGLIGSVAGDRGRKSNYAYGAAKGMLERYAQGLQHRLAGSGVAVTLIKPGPTATPMTANLSQNVGKLASVESVARAIVAAVDAGRPVAYAPGKWRLIMLVSRHLPRFVFNRMDI